MSGCLQILELPRVDGIGYNEIKRKNCIKLYLLFFLFINFSLGIYPHRNNQFTNLIWEIVFCQTPSPLDWEKFPNNTGYLSGSLPEWNIVSCKINVNYQKKVSLLSMQTKYLSFQFCRNWWLNDRILIWISTLHTVIV